MKQLSSRRIKVVSYHTPHSPPPLQLRPKEILDVSTIVTGR